MGEKEDQNILEERKKIIYREWKGEMREVGKEQMMDVKGSGGMERREIKEGRRGAVSGGFRGH